MGGIRFTLVFTPGLECSPRVEESVKEKEERPSVMVGLETCSSAVRSPQSQAE